MVEVIIDDGRRGRHSGALPWHLRATGRADARRPQKAHTIEAVAGAASCRGAQPLQLCGPQECVGLHGRMKDSFPASLLPPCHLFPPAVPAGSW